MLGIQFSLRDSAGNIENGTVSLAEASEALSVSGVQDVSLNTSPSDITSYARDGGDLVITLLGGNTLRLEGFFAGADKELLLSERGLMTRVELDDAVTGELTASYVDVDLTGKWSEYDQLAFLDLDYIEPVVAPLAAPALLGLGGAAAAGVAGVALLDDDDDDTTPGDDDDDTPEDDTPDDDDDTPDGDDTSDDDDDETPDDDDDGDDDDGDDDDTTAPDVDITGGVESTGDLVNGDDYNDGTVSVNGTGEVGATVEVTINGTTVETVIGEDGTWTADFDSADIEQGEYSTDVTVVATDEAGNSTTVVDVLVVDTEAEDLTFDTVEGDDVVNIDEASDGLTLTGTSEAGATVVVELEGQSVETIVGADGTWSASFDASTLPAGSYDSIVKATVTDVAGNAATYMHDVYVDLENALSISTGTVGGDGVVNELEIASAVDISGTGEAGSSVVVTVSGVTQTATVGADGSWTVTYDAGTLPSGTYDATVTAVATDAAGNSVSSSGTFHIDTEVGVAIDAGHSGGDETVNFEESGAALDFTGSADAGATVVVTLGGVSLTTLAGDDGTWSVTFDAGTLDPGEYDTTLTAVATDEYGNTATSTTSVTVDTVAGEVALSPTPIEGDNVINAVEESDGVWVTGTATPGLDVTVTLGGVTHIVTATPAGTFSTLYTPEEVAQGEYDTSATASITDAAGNSASVSVGVQVDTFVTDFDVTTSTGGADGVLNAVETAAGLTLGGTVEEGSTVVVTVAGGGYEADVAGGAWTVDIPDGALATGEGSYDVVVTSTDPAGNVATLTETVTYDTIVNELTVDDNLGGDGIFNAEEVSQGVTLTGTVEEGSTVFVTVQGIEQEAIVDDNGNWSVTYLPGTLAEGEYMEEALITATDAAGNTDSTTASFEVDTIGEAATVVRVARTTTGVDELRVSETSDELSVYAIDEDGNSTEIDITLDDNDLEFSSEVPNGSQIVVSAEDDAGNTSDTLLVLDTGTTRPDGVYFDVDIDGAGLTDFSFGAVDLQFVNGGELTLSSDDLDRITGDDSTLTVHGGADDRVVLTDTAVEEGSTTIDGQSYDIYTLGDEGTVFIDSAIEVVLP